MHRAKYHLALTLETPILSNASGALRVGVDAAPLRYRGQIVLGGSLVRGNLRHSLIHFVDLLGDEMEATGLADRVEQWFGTGGNPDPQSSLRGRLNFDFFWRLDPATVGAPRGQDLRFRTEMGESGTTERGSLQVVEDPFEVGERPVFHGTIRGRFDNETERNEFEHWLTKALQTVAALGAFKGVGFGRVVAAELARMTPIARASAPVSTRSPGDRIGLVLHLDRPFNAGLSAAHQPEGNRYLHRDNIPGSILKGAIAETFDRNGARLNEQLAFDELVVTNALPAHAANPERRLPLPLSLAVVEVHGRCLVSDLALQRDPCLLKVDGQSLVPRFLPDWKSKHRLAAETAMGHRPLDVERLLSVRTSIDKEFNVSAESELFALECTDPFGHVWCADVDLSAIGDFDRERIAENLQDLFRNELEGIGRTRACARVEVRERPFAPTSADDVEPFETPDGERFVILLCSPARLLPSDLQVPPSNGWRELHRLYDAYWRFASNGRLTLCHYYAQQEMVGGEYYWRRFREGPGTDYRPEWLTVPGSVFVVEPAKDDAEAGPLLQRWQRLGLPPAADRSANTDDWRTDPFIPQNGFGEIRVNAVPLPSLNPQETESCTEIVPLEREDDNA